MISSVANISVIFAKGSSSGHESYMVFSKLLGYQALPLQSLCIIIIIYDAIHWYHEL